MSSESASFRHLPQDFQKGVFENIARIIKNSESVQLVGAPGSGTSLIARALTQIPQFRKRYFGKTDGYTFLLLDGNSLLERNSLTLSRLFLSLLKVKTKVTQDSVYIQKEMEEGISQICKKSNLVIIIDHISNLDYPELKTFFTNLYKLYRALYSKLSFLFISNQLLADKSSLDNFGMLGSVITQNAVAMDTFNFKDGIWFINEEEKSTKISLSDSDRKKIYHLSGGFPRTIKRVFESVARNHKISEIESNPEIDLSLAFHLEEISIIPDLVTKIPVLASYVANKSESKELIDGIKLRERLTKNEEIILKLFLANRKDVIKRENVIEAIWGNRALNVSDHAYDQLIHRLRRKLAYSEPVLYIETIRGRGHMIRFK